jgi:hypothetical protein
MPCQPVVAARHVTPRQKEDGAARRSLKCQRLSPQMFLHRWRKDHCCVTGSPGPSLIITVAGQSKPGPVHRRVKEPKRSLVPEYDREGVVRNGANRTATGVCRASVLISMST